MHREPREIGTRCARRRHRLLSSVMPNCRKEPYKHGCEWASRGRGYSVRLGDLTPQLEASRQQLALLGDIAVDRLRPGSTDDLVDWWDGLTLVEQRAVLRANILRVAILPAAHRGGNKYDTDRVRIDWAGELINRVLEQEEGLAVDEGGNRYELAVIPAG